MSNFIRTILAQPVIPAHEHTVTYQGQEIRLRLESDAQQIMDLMILDEGKRTAFALTYSSYCAKRDGKRKDKDFQFSAEMVYMIKLVTTALVVEHGDKPFDESEIAYLSKTKGDLFMTLTAGVTKLMKEAGYDELLQANAGN